MAPVLLVLYLERLPPVGLGRPPRSVVVRTGILNRRPLGSLPSSPCLDLSSGRVPSGLGSALLCRQVPAKAVSGRTLGESGRRETQLFSYRCHSECCLKSVVL